MNRISRSTWQELPIELRKYIASKLDYPSRQNLKLSSKSNYILVENSPLSLDSIQLYLDGPPHNEFTFDIIDSSNQRFKFKNPHKLAGIFDKKSISKLDFKSVSFFIDSCLSPKSENFKMVLKFLEEKSKNSKIKTETFGWMCSKTIDCAFFRIFNCFHVKILSPFDCHLHSWELTEFVKTENFQKHLTSFQTFIESDYPLVPDFLACEQLHNLYVSVPRISAENAWKIIKHFQTRPIINFTKSYFNIFVRHDIKVEELLGLFDVPVKHEPLNELYPGHIQIFLTPSSKAHLLIVEIDRMSLKGAVCRREFLRQDFAAFDLTMR